MSDTDLIKVGYWYSDREPDLPMPETGSLHDKDVDIISYLKNGVVLTSWRGFSNCRICGKMNGTKCLTDGIYQWPEGLAHYVEDHGVELPQDFINHISETLKVMKYYVAEEWP